MVQNSIINTFYQEILPKLTDLFTPDKVILFGSRVSGSAHEESDLDVILVSERFRGVPQHERFPLVRNSIRSGYSIDYLCYTIDEFERMKTRSSVLENVFTGPHQIVLGTL